MSRSPEARPREARGSRWRGGVLLPFRLLGVPVRLDFSFLLVLPLFAYLIADQLPELTVQLERLLALRDEGRPVTITAPDATVAAWWVGLLAATGLFASVLVHELGHAAVARAYGVRAVEIRLWFLGGVAQFRDVPRRKGAEALVAIAGPVTSIALAALFWWALPYLEGSVALIVMGYLAVTNVGLALFNLLPAIPLDGGRVLRSLLALVMPRLRATKVAVFVSATVAAALGAYGLMSGQIFLVLVAFFVYEAGRSEASAAVLEHALGGSTAEDLMTRSPQSVEPDMPLGQFARMRHYGRHAGYPVVDGAGRLLGFALIANAMARLEEGGDGAADGLAVSDVMTSADVVRPGEPATRVVGMLAESATGRLCVTDPTGRLVGVIGKTDVIAALKDA